ncbi:MAG: family 10 glycosylhydrolase [Candidatus Zhuqueibacterota bacterium]
MNKLLLYICLFGLYAAHIHAQPTEFRGVWIAWAGDNVPTKTRIAEMMDDLAAHNMNTVYVDVWRFGYPYFRSQVYHQLTGLYTDPAIEAGRDVLAEMIAEGHRAGLHVEAWFEYGFVACQGTIEHLYLAHPEWFAKKRDGSVLFNGDYRYKWLSHCNPHAQQFLIDLAQEVALNYDVDGIEMDRIRYPELDCGYDSVTVALYKQAHAGAPPPQNTSHSGWKAWRAEKLTEFSAIFYDSIKAVRPDLPVSNAPIVYPYGYDNFCQDWRPWINSNYLDVVSPQVYRATNDSYTYDLNIQLSYVNDRSKFYPGLTSITDNDLVPTSEILAMIKTTRNRGLIGHVIWFYDALADDLPALKAAVYQQKAHVPGMPEDWRRPAIIINESDAPVARSAGWTEYTALSGFAGGCLYASDPGDVWIDYSADVSESGWYELYNYNIFHWNAAKAAPFLVYHAAGIDTVQVDLSVSGQSRWFKLGDYFFDAGNSKKIVRLAPGDQSGRIVFADALMLLNSNRLSGTSAVTEPEKKTENTPIDIVLSQNYPNPFNGATRIQFEIARRSRVTLELFDVLGNRVRLWRQGELNPGMHSIHVEPGDLPGGIYFYRLKAGQTAQTRKMVLVK